MEPSTVFAMTVNIFYISMYLVSSYIRKNIEEGNVINANLLMIQKNDEFRSRVQFE